MLRLLAMLFAVLLLTAMAAAEPFTPKLVAELGSDRFRYPGTINRIVVSADNTRVAVDGSVGPWVYDFATGHPVWRIPANLDTNTETYAIGFAGDRLLVFRHNSANKFFLHHIDPPCPWPVRTVSLPPNDLDASALSPDGRLLAVLVEDQVAIFDTSSGLEVNRVPRPEGTAVLNLRFSADGRRLAVQNDQNVIRVYDRLTGYEAGRLAVGGKLYLYALAPDGNRLTAVTDDNRVESLALLTGVLSRWECPGRPVRNLYALAGDELLSLDSEDEKLHVFEAATGRRVRTTPFAATVFYDDPILSPDGRTVLAVCGQPGAAGGFLTLWDVRTGRRRPQSGEERTVCSRLRFHGRDRLTGEYPVPAAGGGESRSWSQWTLPGGLGRPLSAAGDVSANGLWAVAAGDGVVRLSNAATGRSVRALRLPASVAAAATWFLDDGTVGVESRDDVLVWTPATGRVRRVPLEPGDHGTGLIGRGPWFAVIAKSGDVAAVRVYDLRTGRRTASIPTRTNPGGWQFSPGGRWLARYPAAERPDGGRQVLELYDPATGRPVRRFIVPVGELRGFSPDGRTAVFVGDDAEDETSGLVAVELATGQTRWRLPVGGGWRVAGVGVAPDGRLAVSTTDGFLRVWDISGMNPQPPAAAYLWDALGGEAEGAFRAINSLARFPAVAMPLLTAKLPPVAAVDPLAVDGWLRDLDSPEFAVRRAAKKNFASAGPQARPKMEAVLQVTPSAEVRDRLTTLLDPRPTSADVRAVRAAEVLERIAGDLGLPSEEREQAVVLLRAWAGGAAGTLTNEAKETLARLRR